MFEKEEGDWWSGSYLFHTVIALFLISFYCLALLLYVLISVQADGLSAPIRLTGVL